MAVEDKLYLVKYSGICEILQPDAVSAEAFFDGVAMGLMDCGVLSFHKPLTEDAYSDLFGDEDSDLIQKARAEAYAEALEAAAHECEGTNLGFKAEDTAEDIRALPNPYLYNDGKGVG